MTTMSFRSRFIRTLRRLQRGNTSFLVNAILKRIPIGVKRRMFRGNRYYCPVCDSRLRRFLPLGEEPLPNILCPVCGSQGRHRLVMRYFETSAGLNDRLQRMLHLAPEPFITEKLSSIRNLDYISADLDSPIAMVHCDITDMPFPENSFDIIYCSHVLEHIPDDRKAMLELRRMLKPGGWALILVPIGLTPTVEDPSIEDPLERLRLFGQHDHVRMYGPDFRNRLEEAGFRVTTIDPRSIDADSAIANWNEFGPGEINYCQ